MAQKTITQLQLRDNVSADLNLPSDDGIQSYRVTAAQIKDFVLANGNVLLAMLAQNIFNGLTGVTPAHDDNIVIADASDSGNTKKISILDLFTPSIVTGASDDYLLISDTSDSNRPKRMLVSELIESLGSEASRSEATNYQAATDGFFIGLMYAPNSGGYPGVYRMIGSTGSSSPATTSRGGGYLYGHANAQYCDGQHVTFCIPVKKNQYYRADASAQTGSYLSSMTRQYAWIPIE